MGYYTHYTGDVTGPDLMLNEFVEAADQDVMFGEYNQPLSDWLDGEFFGGESAKWYHWESDMEALSKGYPHLLFTLEGEGEESGDLWKAYARNGKVITVRAKVVFDTPDLDKELPTPDIEAALQKIKDKKRAELDNEIARLTAEREALT